VLSASGSFLSASGIIFPDKISILFTDVLLDLHRESTLNWAIHGTIEKRGT